MADYRLVQNHWIISKLGQIFGEKVKDQNLNKRKMRKFFGEIAIEEFTLFAVTVLFTVHNS